MQSSIYRKGPWDYLTKVLKMASNGLGMRAGRGPSCILVCLVVVVITLFYSYWGVSSKNSTLLKEVSVLEDRMRTLAARKLTSDKKSAALTSELTKIQEENNKMGEIMKSKDFQIEQTKKQLSEKESELTKLHEQERVYREELEKLKAGANGSSSRLKALSTKAEKLLEKFNEVKLNYSALLEKIGTVTNERDNCKESLKALTLELVEAKKSQDEKRSSYKEKPKSKGKSYEGEKADEEESSEVTQKGEEASDQDKGVKKRETGEENVEDEDEGGKEDNVDKDENIEKEEKGGENLDKESQNSTSSSSNSAKAPGEKKSDANQPSSEAREKLEVATLGNSLHSKDKQVADTGGEQEDENQENGEQEGEEKNKDERMDNEQEKDGQDVEDLDLDMKRDTRLRGHPVHPQSEDVLRRQFVDEKQAKSEDEKLQYQGKVSRLQDRGMMRNQDEWADARMEGA